MRFVLTTLFMVGGLFFFIIGTLGLFRFKEVLTRVHATAKCDTLGALLCILALIIYNGFNMLSAKLLFVVIFLWITTPTATHLIARCEMAFRNTKKYKTKKVNDFEIICIGEDDGNGDI